MYRRLSIIHVQIIQHEVTAKILAYLIYLLCDFAGNVVETYLLSELWFQKFCALSQRYCITVHL